MVAAVRGSGSRSAGGRGARSRISTCGRRRARRQARAVFDDVVAGSVSDGEPWARPSIAGSRPSPGFTDEPIQTSTYRAGFDAFWEIDLFGRIRSAIRAASATAAERFEAALDDVRVSVAAEVARNYFELRGLQQQLAVARAQPHQPAGDAAADDGAPRRRHRRRAGRRQRGGARGRDRSERAAASYRARGPRSSARGADRRASGRAHGRSRAAAVSAARQGAAARRSGAAAATPARRPRRGTAACGRDRERGGRDGRSLSAHHHLGLPRPARRPRQHVRQVATRAHGR